MANKDANNERFKLTEADETNAVSALPIVRQSLPLDEILTSPLGGEPMKPCCPSRLYMVGSTAEALTEQLEGVAVEINKLEPLPADELPHDAPGKKINPLGVTLKTADGDKSSYIDTVCALERELRYITNPDHIFDPQCYRKGNVNGVLIHDTPEKRVTRDISFHLFYVFGTAYLKGHTDNGCFQIFYNQAEGFNIDFAEDYKTLENDAPITRLHSAKDFDGALATLLEHLCPLGETV